jgi:D-glycero-alpha-D-manno-heptose-7-phosphate kinase
MLQKQVIKYKKYMIIAKSPLRISLGGGGTDLPSYYKKFGGFLISATIDKHVYVSIAETFNKKFILKYSKLEEVNNIKNIKHPIFRETLKYLKIKTPINISSHADIPAGTGLGSSGSFTVSLIHALSKLKELEIKLSKTQLAETACKIEINILREPVGKQDQYTAAFGGINEYHFKKNGSVIVKKLRIRKKNINKLKKNLLIFFTGYSRSSYKILKSQDSRTKTLDKEMIYNLDEIKEIGINSKECLEKGNLNDYGLILNDHWALKKRRSSNISNKKINYLYDFAKANGALGGKLIGAGGGGFLMFYTNNPNFLASKLKNQGLNILNYNFDYEGSVLI